MGYSASMLPAFQLHKTQSSRVVPKIKQPISNSVVIQPEIANAFAVYYKDHYKAQELENKEEKKIRTF